MLSAVATFAVKGPLARRRRWLAAPALFLATGCAAVSSSAISTAKARPTENVAITLSATRDPENAQELGLVEAHGQLRVASLGAIAREFSTRVANLGADYGRIDSFDTRFEIVKQTYAYECGWSITTGTSPDGVPLTMYIPQTCTGQTDVEVGTLTFTGRAFRTQRATP